MAVRDREEVEESQNHDPVDEPSVFLDRMLDEPNVQLSEEASICLLNHCIVTGKRNIESVGLSGKKITLFIGVTGAGKSTFINALYGCTMIKTSFVHEVRVSVDPESPIVAPTQIGHERSETFRPVFVSARTHGEMNHFYCDLPGMNDTRGDEISISNAVIIQEVLRCAGGVNIVLLATRSCILSRGTNFPGLLQSVEELFGGLENLKQYQNAILFGITNVPCHDDQGNPVLMESLQERLGFFDNPVADILSQRLFLFDPLDERNGNTDFWSLQECRDKIAGLATIEQGCAANMFQTTLTPSNKIKLLEIVRSHGKKLTDALERKAFDEVKDLWILIAQLRLIGHDEVDCLIKSHAQVPLQGIIGQHFSDCHACLGVGNLPGAEEGIEWLGRLQQLLPDESTLQEPLQALKKRCGRLRNNYQNGLETEKFSLEVQALLKKLEMESQANQTTSMQLCAIIEKLLERESAERAPKKGKSSSCVIM